MFSKNIKTFLFTLFLFSNLNLPRLEANNEDTKNNYTTNYSECGKSLIKKIDFDAKFVEETIFKCEQALRREKSQIRIAGIYYVIAELKNFLEFRDKNILYVNIKKRIELYEKALNILDNVSPLDIKDFNENKPVASQPDYLEAKEYLKVLKQNSIYTVNKLKKNLELSPSQLADNEDINKKKYIFNYLECLNAPNLTIEDQKKYADAILFKCEQALRWEKSQIRKAALLTVIAEFEYVSKTSLEGEYENKKIEIADARKRIELYKQALNIFDNVSPQDIKDFNENKPIPSQPDYLGARQYINILKQNNFSRLGRLQQDLMQYVPAINNFLRAIELNELDTPESEKENAKTLGFLATSYAQNGQINESIKTLDKIIDDKYNCKYEFNCLSNKLQLATLYSQSGQINKQVDVLNSINIKESDNLSKKYLCAGILGLEVSKINILDGNYKSKYKEKIELNEEHFEFLKNCEYENSYINFLTEANYWHNRKDYNQAIDSYNDALNTLEEIFEDENYQTANIKLDIGQSYMGLGEYDLAIKYFSEAFEYYDQPEAILNRKVNSDKFSYATLLIATLPSESQQIYKGVKYLNEAFEYEFKFRQKIVPFLSIEQRLNDNIGFSKNSQDIYNTSFQLIEFLKKRDLDYKKATRLALNARINIQGLNEDIERKQSFISKTNNIYKKSFNEIRSLESKLSKKNVEDAKYEKLKDKLNTLENNLYKELPEIKPQLIKAEDIADLLPETSVLVEF